MNRTPIIEVYRLTQRWFCLGCLCLCVIASIPASAQNVPPGAGDVLRDLQRKDPQLPTTAVPNLIVPADADRAADTSQHFTVTSIRIEGNRRISTQDLQPLVEGIAGHESTLGDLRQAASRVTALYRERGYVVARAFVPAQRIDGGQVLIIVLEGSLHAATVLNHSIVKQTTLNAIVDAQRLNGKVIQAGPTDRTLLLLSDVPGVGKVSGILKPGDDVGTSDLIIPVEQGASHEGDVSLDNYGNRYTGAARLNGHIDFDSPMGIGDRLSVRGTVTEEDLLYGRLAYELPANHNGLRIGIALASTYYDLGKEFANLDANGTANTAGFFGSYPALRGITTNVWLSAAVDYRKLRDDVRSTDTITDKAVAAATIGAYGDHADSLAGGAYSTWNASAVIGSLDIESAAALAIDRSAPRTDGGYEKLVLSLTRLQAITPQTSLFVSLLGQAASKNLDASEKFVTGGIYGVRAYPQGEGIGDAGWLTTFELRRVLPYRLQGSFFYDLGDVKYNQDAYASGSNRQALHGFGVDLGGVWGAFSAKATVAVRDAAPAITAPDHRPRLWGIFGWRF